MKKIFSLVAAFLIFTAFFTFTASATTYMDIYGGRPVINVIDSGSCGANVTWKFDSSNTLTITGSGKMDNYSFDEEIPWRKYNDSIASIVFEGDILNVYSYAFMNTLYARIESNYTDGVLYCGTYLLGITDKVPKELNVKDGTRHIAACANIDSDNIETLVFPDSLKSIGLMAFKGNSGLRDVYIGKKVYYIGTYAFGSCENLEAFHVASDCPYFSTDEYGVLFDKDKTKLVYFPYAGDTPYVYKVPDSVEELMNYSFQRPYYLEKHKTKRIIIGSNVKKFGDEHPYINSFGQYVFGNVGSEVMHLEKKTFLLTVDRGSAAEECAKAQAIPYIYSDEAVTAEGVCSDSIAWVITEDGKLIIYGDGMMDDYADNEDVPWHEHAKSVTVLKVEQGVKNIASNALTDLDLVEEMHFPASVEIIDSNMFENYSLRAIIVSSDNKMYYTEDGVLFDKPGKTLLVYPQSKQEQYYAVPDGIEKIKGCGFFGNLKNLVLPDSVTEICDYAFSCCYGLEKIDMGKNVHTIGVDAFYKCYELREVKLSEKLKSIGAFAFAECIELPVIEIPEDVEEIGDYAFEKCCELASISIPSSVKSMGIGVFEHGAWKYVEDFTIYTPENSTAWKYAIENGHLYSSEGFEVVSSESENTKTENVTVAEHESESLNEESQEKKNSDNGDFGDIVLISIIVLIVISIICVTIIVTVCIIKSSN